MRNVIFGMNISIDACYDHTKFGGGDDEIFEYFSALSHDVDLAVYGRKMYELIVPYWTEVAKNQSGTKEANTFAQNVVDIDKVLFTRTLDTVEGNTRIMRDGLEDEIRRLKQLPGKKISIGGMSLRSQLTALGLVDEFFFVVHPVMVGSGPYLMGDAGLPQNLNLKLVDCKIFKNGCVGLHYLKKD